jgi:formylglycine-generating enzyme required for sulfatase activity
MSLIKAMIEEDVHPSKQCSEKPSEGRPESTAARPALPGDMVFVRGGCFKMGDVFGMGNDDEKPAHEVCVDDFYIGRHEVTLGEFREFMREEGEAGGVAGGNCYRHNGEKWLKDPSGKWDNAGYPQGDSHPATCVSWDDAVAYIGWKSVKDGRMYRLPTEAEWEYAARGGGNNYMYSWGNNPPSGNIADESARQNFASWFVWDGYDDGYVYTAPVGSFKSNILGVHDITGNVWEWVSDWYSDAYYENSASDNPLGPASGTSKVLRGGSWFDVPSDLRTTRRSWNTPTRRTFYNGFRLAASAE